ncbi:MAG: ATP-dependent zinc metalloprotease FtsH [Bdellovibrionales bacterium]|nr:ATP-dependent zinc metalloprotease FtsH [Bdellovibrionales bacterium]
MKSNARFLVVWLVVIGAILWIVGQSQVMTKKENVISFNEFIHLVEDKKVESVTFRSEGDIVGKFKPSYKEGAAFSSYGDTRSETYLKVLKDNGITANYEKEPKPSFLQTALISWLPILAILFIFFLFMRQLQSGSNKAMSFGQSRAKLYNENQSKVRFPDVAGCEESKAELEEIVEFLKNPKKFTKLGGRIPKGVLLVGPPGTGKTLLAKAVAGEASVPFFSISGSDFVEMFVGVGASRVRSLFDSAKKAAPCLIFIDEIDAVGRQRGAGLGGGHDEREQTLNQLLVEMDGFEGTEGIIIIAATNRVDVLDPALLRPGRFDRRVMVPKPDLQGRLAILKVHARKVPLDKEIDLSLIARGTPGFVGADLENLVNEAALTAARANRDLITNADFEYAKDKVSMGSPRHSLVVSDEEKRHTAYHESGHALVGRLVPGNDPVHKVTIVPRGPAMGVTMTLPTEDRFSLTKVKAEALISFMMGGRAAEEVVFGQFTTGASNDIERATDLARKMVTEWGMSEKLGPLNFGAKNDNVFLGREFGHSAVHFSEDTNRMIDEEIRAIVERNNERAKRVLMENLDKLHAMSAALLEYETIDMADVDSVLAGRPIVKKPLEGKVSSSGEGLKDAASSPGVIDLSKPVKA